MVITEGDEVPPALLKVPVELFVTGTVIVHRPLGPATAVVNTILVPDAERLPLLDPAPVQLTVPDDTTDDPVPERVVV